MKFVKAGILNGIMLLCFQGIAQQSPDHVQLPAVEISSPRLSKFSVGNKVEVIDSLTMQAYSDANLSDLLTNQSQIFVKTYGISSLASTSFRGAGSGHTAFLWNGFNLQSPIYGMLDIALVPVNFINDVQLQYGGNGALWGSGAVGGTVHMNNNPLFGKGLSVMVNSSMGSYSNYQQQLSVLFSNKKFASSIKLFNQTAENDFSYENKSKRGWPQETLSNSQLKQYGLMQENYYKINKRQQINTRVWYQFNDRNLPPSMTENISLANQQDDIWRITSEWKRQGRRMHLSVRSAYFNESLLYTNPVVNLVSTTRSTAFITEAETHFRLSKFDLLNIGVNNTFNEVSSVNYKNLPNQNRLSFFASYKLGVLKSRLITQLSVRQLLVDGTVAPLVFSLGTDARILKHTYFKLNVSQHYRVPTFNDLYWAQGGNPNLKPENGWNEEAGLLHKYLYKAFAWEVEATAFNRNVENWIIWLPNTSGIWTPENVLEVWSRGVEYKANVHYKANNFKLGVNALYNYILSTNRNATAANINSIDKQLIYVPKQNGQASLTLSYKQTSLIYTQTYTGYRYTSSDNSTYLLPYTIGNIRLSQLLKAKKAMLKVYVQLNNIWNEEYQVIAYRAMPMLNYKFGLSLYFNQENKIK